MTCLKRSSVTFTPFSVDRESKTGGGEVRKTHITIELLPRSIGTPSFVPPFSVFDFYQISFLFSSDNRNTPMTNVGPLGCRSEDLYVPFVLRNK